MPVFEVLLVSIDWESPDKVRAIIPSKRFLEASTREDNKYEYDIVLYTKENNLYFQFAIKTKCIPYFKSNDDKWIQLCNIQGDLWIIKNEWKIGQKAIGYHYCPSINTIGKIKIGLRDSSEKPHYITLDINSNIDDFDFPQLKNDFEGGLWELITSNKSQVCSNKIEIRYCDKIFRYPENKSIIEFLKAFDKIEKNPKRELSPTKEIRKTEKVIPIAETYRKLSAVGDSTHLPSKAVLENYDIFENKFVCFMLYRIHFIVSKNIQYTSLQVERLEKEIEILHEKIVILEDPDPKVNAEIVEQEILFQEQRVNKWVEISRKLTFNIDADFVEKIIKLKKVYNIHSNSYWCSTLKNPNFVIKFPDNTREYLTESTEYIFEAVYSKNETAQTRAGDSYIKTEIIDLRKIECTSEKNILNKQIENRKKLEKNNWSQLSILSTQQRDNFILERTNQVQTLEKKIRTLTKQIARIKEFSLEHAQLQPAINKKLRSDYFVKIKWRDLQGFKPSMTFIQNIVYRNALRYYKEILNSEGIDIAIFGLYENVTSYGLREMPQVYELWCLITQIKVLEEGFHFKCNKNDIATLLKNIDPTKNTIEKYSEINFTNALAGRKVKLHYQKKIKDNKRPDFILEVSCNNRQINLVLDSKFKNYNYKKSIIYEISELEKKYGQDDNYVFILHPCSDGIFEERKIKYTNYGGEKITEAQETRYPFHKYGYIELKPNFTDSLKKLFAMSFEYLLEPSNNAEQDNNKIDPKPINDMFCLNCGGTEITIKESLRGKKNNKHFYNCTCNKIDCGHNIYIDYCWNCKTKLFKHGLYWDYHLESTWSIFDIRCPHCGMTVADRPQINKY